MRFPHTLSLHDARDIHSLHCHFERSEKSFSFPSSFAKPFRGSTVPAFPAIQCFPFLAVGHAPSYRQRKRSLGFARDDDTGRTRFPAHTLYDTADIHSLHCHFERSEKSFSSLFSMTPSLSLLREAPSPPFRDTVFPISRCRARSLLPPTKKIPRLRSG